MSYSNKVVVEFLLNPLQHECKQSKKNKVGMLANVFVVATKRTNIFNNAPLISQFKLDIYDSVATMGWLQPCSNI